MTKVTKLLLFLAFTALIALRAFAGSSVEYTYDKYGNCTAITTKAGDAAQTILEQTTYTYDDYRRPISMVESQTSADPADPEGRNKREWKWIYDRYFDDLGSFDAYAHTSKQWRVQVEPAYDSAGNRHLSAHKFDHQDRIIEEITGMIEAPGGAWSTGLDTELHYFSYDENGNKQTYTDPRGRVTTYVYDNRNRLHQTIEPLNRITTIEHDYAGNKTDATFPDTRSQHWHDYDPFGQAWTMIDERNNTTNLTYQWGPMKKLGTVTTHRDKDGGGTEPQTTTFTYDGMGRSHVVAFPDGTTEVSEYQNGGQLASWKTRKGQTKTIEYDARGREISNNWHDNNQTPDISRSWDDANRLSTICNIYSTIGYQYDGAGLVTEEDNTVAGTGLAATTFSRYPNGNVSDVHYPDGISLHREYISRGQLKSVSDGRTAQPTIAYTYLQDGKVDYADYGNRVRTKFDYDGRGFTNLVRHYRISSEQDLSRRDYYRDERDRITSFQKGSNNPVNPMEDGRGDHYWYDAEGQLTDADYGAIDPVTNPHNQAREDHFYYDALGNRFGSDYVANKGWVNFLRRDNKLNQYASWSPSVIYHDDNYPGWGPAGNGVMMADGWVTASYNALNQPVAVWSPAYNGSSNFMWFGYDPLGRCVKRVVGPSMESGTATYLYYDGWNLIQEGPSSTSASRNYIHGGRVDEIVKQIRPSDQAERYFQYDARGHCTLQTDAGGNIVEQYEYDAFGQPYFYDANGNAMTVDGRPGSAWGNRFLFTGREYLSDLKLYDYRNRLYQPELGRFLQPDPKEFGAGDYNLYRYCHNDPVNKSDPMGLDAPIVVVKDPERKTVIEADLKHLLKIPAFGQHFDNTKKNNVVRDAQNPENKTLGRSQNGLKTNNTVRDFGFHEFLRDLVALFGRHTDYGTGATSFYDPYNRQTAAKGSDREPVFGLANELGEMINANNGTWGLPNSTVNDNRSIWYENQAREAYGAELRPYH